MKNKICHITSAHSRYDVRIFEKQCISLVNNGYDVTLIVNDDLNDEVLMGVNIVSTGFTARNRFERFFKSKRNLYKKAIEINADIFHFHDPDLLATGTELKKRGKKIIFDSHEDIPAQIMYKTYIPKFIRGLIAFIYRNYEEKSVKNYDAVISVTPKIFERFLKINKNAFMVTNYPIAKNLVNRADRTLGKICFAGGVTSQWNHINIVKAIENIENIEYSLAGTGSKDYLSTLSNLGSWQKVKYLGKISHEDVKVMYSKSTMGIALLSYDTQVGIDGTLGNTKIFEIMEAGLPIICSANRIWETIVSEAECGITVNPNNIDEISEAIKYLISNPQIAKRMGDNGRKAVLAKYNWDTQEKILLDVYALLLKNI